MGRQLLILVALIGIGAGPARADADLRDAVQLRAVIAGYQPVEIRVDLSRMPPTERAALSKLVEACRVMDALYLRQEWGGNGAVLERLISDQSPGAAERLMWFQWNKGPWSIREGTAPFVSGVPSKPEVGTLYPPDATKADVKRWLDALMSPERQVATGSYTVIRRRPEGGFVAVPYSVEYQPELARAAALLREAATVTGQPSLKALLEKRAQAFLSNRYTESDAALVALDSTVDLAIGPFEPDEDRWFGIKTGFQCLLSVRDDPATKQVAAMAAQLPILHQRLPVNPSLRGTVPDRPGPIVVLNLLYASGYGDQARMFAGYGLPNDPEVVARDGTRTGVFRSTLAARFPVTERIAEQVLAPGQPRPRIDDVILDVALVRLMDGLGPRTVTRGIRPIAEAMEEQAARAGQLRSMLLELFAVGDFVERGVFAPRRAAVLYSTFVVLALERARDRTLSNSAAAASMLILNALFDDGAARIASGAVLDLEPARVVSSVRRQLGELLAAQTSGDVAWVRGHFTRDAVIRPELVPVLEKLKELPLALRPVYVTARELVP